MPYRSVAIANLKCFWQLDYTAHFGDLKQKKNDVLKLVTWLVTSPPKWRLEWTAPLTRVYQRLKKKNHVTLVVLPQKRP